MGRGSYKNIYSSIIDIQKERDVMINPRLICNKEDKKQKMISMIEVAYNEIIENKSYYLSDECNNNILGCCRNIYICNREEEFRSKQGNGFVLKVHTILPNVNFELKQIKNLSFSNTQLNEYLVLNSYENESFEQGKGFRSGFLTMSQQHRLIALRDDTRDKGYLKQSQSIKKIMFGIWLNLKDESPSHKKSDLDGFLSKYKHLIYQKCFEYIQLTSNIDFTYSPSPDQGVFLLVIFYKTMQCHYEVTIIPNEEDKCFEFQTEEETPMFGEGYGPNWLIVKNKYRIKSSESFSIDLNKEVFSGRIMSMSEYLTKKTGIKNKNTLTKSTCTKNTTPSKSSAINYFKDNLEEIFDNKDLEIDDMDDLYNYPLIMPTNFKTKDTVTKGNISQNEAFSRRESKIERSSNKQQDNIFKSSSSNTNFKDNTQATVIKSNEEVSRASTNNYSNKPSSVSSQNSFNKPRNSNNNSIPTKYITIINQQAETIKTLQNKISALESNINLVLNELITPNNTSRNQTIIYSGQRQMTQPTKEVISNPVPKYLHKQLFQSIKETNNEPTNTSIKIPSIVYNNSIFSEDED